MPAPKTKSTKPALLTIACPCGASASHPAAQAGYIAKIEATTGFTGLLNDACATVWLCPTCAAKARDLARQLVALWGGDRYVYLPQLLD